MSYHFYVQFIFSLTSTYKLFKLQMLINICFTVWSDIRTDSMVDQIIAKFPDHSKNHLKPLCGLPVSPYFSALKIRWLKQNVKTIRKAMRDHRCKVGTMDTWIIWVNHE